MKTKLQILTALALIIQVMVNGQTQGNQASNSKKIQVTNKRTFVTIGAYDPKTQKAVVNTETQNAPPITDHTAVKNSLVITGSISAYNKSLLSKATAKDAKELTAQAEEMLIIEKQLRIQAKIKQGEERIKLINSANELGVQITLVQIQASEINGKISLETFNFNKEMYLELLNDPNVNDNFVQRSEALNAEAEQNMKLAKEMRQESYAMPSATSKLGTMLNAEEKENIALNLQKQAIDNLNKLSTSVASIK
jgi:hypothetical protein